MACDICGGDVDAIGEYALLPLWQLINLHDVVRLCYFIDMCHSLTWQRLHFPCTEHVDTRQKKSTKTHDKDICRAKMHKTQVKEKYKTKEQKKTWQS
jgi:hypothetical protein